MVESQKLPEYNMDTMPLRRGHILILMIASAGQFFGGALAILVGVIAPLIAMTHHPGLSPWLQGFIFACGLIGIMLGSLFFGRFSDKYGYLFFFRLCPLVIAGASLGVYFSHSLVVLTVCLLLIGFAIGGAYALDPSYVSEIMPKKWKRTMLGISKATSGLGNIGMILVAWYVLKESSDPEIWNHLFLFLTFFAVVTFLARLWFVESPEWLALHGKVEEAEKNVKHFLGQDVYIGELASKKDKTTRPQSSRRSRKIPRASFICWKSFWKSVAFWTGEAVQEKRPRDLRDSFGPNCQETEAMSGLRERTAAPTTSRYWWKVVCST